MPASKSVPASIQILAAAGMFMAASLAPARVEAGVYDLGDIVAVSYSGAVVRVQPDGTSELLATGAAGYHDAAFDSISGDVFLASSKGIDRLDWVTGAIAPVVADLPIVGNGITKMEVDSQGSLYVLTAMYSTQWVFEVDPVTGQYEVVFENHSPYNGPGPLPGQQFVGLAIDADDQVVIMSDAALAYRIQPDGSPAFLGSARAFAERTSDIELTGEYTMLFGTSDNTPCPMTCRGVIEWDRANRSASVLSEGGNIYAPWDLELGLAGTLYIMHLGVGGAVTLPPSIVAIDMATGENQYLAGVPEGRGFTVVTADPACNGEPRVAIDVRPYRETNHVNPDRDSLVPVAVLGSECVAVADVDLTSLAFGIGGARAYFAHRFDVDGDGYEDLVTFYRMRDTGIEWGDSEACLSGARAGVDFEACDTIVTVPYGCGLGAELALVLAPLTWWRARRRAHPARS